MLGGVMGWVGDLFWVVVWQIVVLDVVTWHTNLYEQGSTITLYATRPRPTTVAHRMVTCAVNGRNLVGCEQSKCVCTKEVGEMVALLQLIAMVPHWFQCFGHAFGCFKSLNLTIAINLAHCSFWFNFDKISQSSKSNVVLFSWNFPFHSEGVEILCLSVNFVVLRLESVTTKPLSASKFITSSGANWVRTSSTSVASSFTAKSTQWARKLQM